MMKVDKCHPLPVVYRQAKTDLSHSSSQILGYSFVENSRFAVSDLSHDSDDGDCHCDKISTPQRSCVRGLFNFERRFSL
jgi:hypothetical protein